MLEAKHGTDHGLPRLGFPFLTGTRLLGGIESREEILVAASLVSSGVDHCDTPSAAPGGIRGFRIFGSLVAPRVPLVGREPTDRLEAVKGEVPRVTG